jgi:acyl-CoA synthetase (AMP-forming)/AMP-acid ligase II
MRLDWENISDAIFHHAHERPDAVAIVDAGLTLSYGELAELVRKAAVYLLDQGIGAGDHVGFSLRSSTDHLILLLAARRVGAVLVDMPPLSAPGQLAALSRKLAVKILFLDSTAAAVDGIHTVPVEIGWRAHLAEKSGDCRKVGNADKPGVILVTFGTSGIPMGAVTSNRLGLRRLQTHIDTIYRGKDLSPQRPGTFLLLGSLGISSFYGGALAQLLMGGIVVVAPEFANPLDLCRFVASWDDAVCVVTANMCRIFAICAKGTILFPNVRALVTSGLPLSAAEKLAVVDRVTPNLYEIYGTAGMGAISCVYPEDMRSRAASVGRPIPRMTVEIVDGADNVLPAGAVGHLRCRGPESVEELGFYGEERAASGIRNGWYYPGDLAVLDAGGYISLRGRAVELIRRGGMEIQPAEIEDVLRAYPNVSDAAVVGRPLPDGSEEVIAFLVPRGPIQQDDLAKYCADRIAAEKRPRGIYFTKGLPMLAIGIVDRAQLKTVAIDHATRREKAATEQAASSGATGTVHPAH